MLSFGWVLVVLISLVIVVVALIIPLFLVIKMIQSSHNSQVFMLERMVTLFKNQTVDLLNRLQSEDTKTYKTLTNLAPTNPMTTMNSESNFIPAHTDASEAAMAAYNAQGTGEVIFDDVYNEALLDLMPRND